VTAAVPEIATVARAMPARELIPTAKDRAAPDGTLRPFQETMRRFGRKLTSIRSRTSCRSRRSSSMRCMSTAIRCR
jgi:hypothetical protein